ncbi:HAMP domain-containing histidine kinase [Ramlibacter sp. RBP-2]|uniref:histidine kinase n=1 Tax=Ramlibacter lithotrophicus TaxID=2606681 RepID=A0A7X6DH94_9BURK|nr:HAMP domain-containing sensor histidine kinase [Ramlibacter lithotrophicus]NKE67156.1 HAMP domain-containing histidine kinase [Ramlibacter lithotrophicus]
MKPDLPAAVATPAEAQWVEAELVRSLLRTARTTQLLGLFLVPIIVGVLWSDVAWSALALWSACALALAGVRFAVMRRYVRDVAPLGAAEHLAFFARYRFLWPVSAMVWGSSTLLYFDRSSLADQFICWLLLAGLAMFSINALSTHLATLRAYLDTLALTALAVMLWRVGAELQFRGPYYHYWIIALLLIFWEVLREAGLRLHMTHRRNFELQFRNNQLIESLTRQTQAALDAVEIKNRFLASAAHDIRQPVHALSLYADWLGSEPELVHELAPKIVESTKAVNALFDSLFDLVRLDSGKIKLNIEPVDLAQLVHDLELQYRPLAQARGLQFRVHATPGRVLSDPILLRRIVGNLLSNAIKYTERGGLLLASRAGSGGCRIEVWDTGVGIAPVHQREIFREFYKVPAHGGTEDGFGLGLYIVARLSAILGHPIDLASRPGRGTVFRLRLAPTDARQAADRAAASVAQLVSMP